MTEEMERKGTKGKKIGKVYMGWAPVRRGILGRRKDMSYSEIKVEVLTRTAFVSDHVCV